MVVLAVVSRAWSVLLPFFVSDLIFSPLTSTRANDLHTTLPTNYHLPRSIIPRQSSLLLRTCTTTVTVTAAWNPTHHRLSLLAPFNTLLLLHHHQRASIIILHRVGDITICLRLTTNSNQFIPCLVQSCHPVVEVGEFRFLDLVGKSTCPDLAKGAWDCLHLSPAREQQGMELSLFQVCW